MKFDFFVAETHHVPALQQFQCAQPVKPRYSRQRGRHHPKPYAIEVQSRVRTLKPNKIKAAGETLMLASHDENLAAVLYLQNFDTSHIAQIHSPFATLVALVAVSNQYQGNGLGGQVLDLGVSLTYETFRESHNNGSPTIIANIHTQNISSQRLFQSRDFFYLTDTGKFYELWMQQ